MSDRHREAILALVEVDPVSKRVLRIVPEFFPPTTPVLPACLSRLSGSLQALSLDHCKELTGLPPEFVLLEQLKELSIDVTSFREPLPPDFGNLGNLRTLIVKGNCCCFDSDWSKSAMQAATTDSTTAEPSAQWFFPPSMAKLTKLKHLETHVRNLLQIPTKALDTWSSSLESLVTIHDLLSSTENEHQHQHKHTSTNESSSNSITTTTATSGGFVLPRSRYDSYSTDDSSEDELYHLLMDSCSLEDDDGDEVDGEDSGFSLIGQTSHHSHHIFRKALEGQLEVRAFRLIGRFKNLRSLTLLFDDSRYRTDFTSIRNRLHQRRKYNKYSSTTMRTRTTYGSSSSSYNCNNNYQRHHELPYSIPLSLLAGPLSLSLKELDIGTTITNTTRVSSSTHSSYKKKSSRIPIQIAWIDILQDFPMLQHLRLQDCRCSFSGVDLAESLLQMPDLRSLVLDRCPDFALVENNIRPAIQQQQQQQAKILSFLSREDIEFIHVRKPDDIGDDDDGSEEINFSQIHDCDDDNDNGNDNDDDEYFQPLNDADADIKMEDPGEISRIIRLSGMLVDTVLTPKDDDDDEEENNYIDNVEKKKLSELCHRFLARCPKLAIVSLRDCKVPTFCENLLVCLPKKCLRELTLDINSIGSRSVDGVSLSANYKEDLWAMIKSYPFLERLQGTCLNGLSDSEQEAIHRFLIQRGQQDNMDFHKPNSPISWRVFWDKKKQQEGKNNNNNQLLLSISFPSLENDSNKNSSSNNNTENSNEKPQSVATAIPSTNLSLSASLVPLENENRTPPPPQPPPNAFRLQWLVSAIMGQQLFSLNKSGRNNATTSTSTAASTGGGGVVRSIRRSNSRDLL
jgi:hypothetical protein